MRTNEKNEQEEENVKKKGENMNDKKYSYCNDCEDLVEYDIYEEMITEQYKGEEIEFKFKIGRCKDCGSEVATDIQYNTRKSLQKIEAYKKIKGIINSQEISEILEKYNVGKESLAVVAGFGTVTIKRYYDGFIPAREYSDVLKKLLNDEKYFMESTKKNKQKLKGISYKKICERFKRLDEISNYKVNQIVNYIVINLGEVTPLALEKLLFFSNGVNYALNGNQLIYDECQAWQHGPVYPYIYNKYKKYVYRPIDDGIKSSHGCMLSKVSQDEIKAIDMVIRTFGLYSPRTLEMISHTQAPWIEKRVNHQDNEAGKEMIDECAVKQFYKNNQLNTEEKITCYILNCIKEQISVL